MDDELSNEEFLINGSNEESISEDEEEFMEFTPEEFAKIVSGAQSPKPVNYLKVELRGIGTVEAHGPDATQNELMSNVLHLVNFMRSNKIVAPDVTGDPHSDQYV